jgi:hypothetical protein
MVQVTDENGPAVADAVRFVLQSVGSPGVSPSRSVKGRALLKR